MAALAAGEAEFGDIPGDLIEACAEAGLPLLRVPVAYSFATVTDRVTRQITGGDGLMGVLTRQRSLVAAVAALAARDRGPAVLAEVLAWSGRPRPALLGAVPDRAPGRRRRRAPGERDRQRLARAHVASGSLSGPRSVTAVPADVPRAVAWLLVVEQPADPAMIDELASLVALEREVALRRPEPDDALAAALCRTKVAEVSAAPPSVRVRVGHAGRRRGRRGRVVGRRDRGGAGRHRRHGWSAGRRGDYGVLARPTPRGRRRLTATVSWSGRGSGTAGCGRGQRRGHRCGRHARRGRRGPGGGRHGAADTPWPGPTGSRPRRCCSRRCRPNCDGRTSCGCSDRCSSTTARTGPSW